MAARDKLLTISIAAYNAEDTLRTTLSSLEAVSDRFDELEIIIVDDGSSDSTPHLAEDFAELYPGSVRVISKPNGGYGSTINESVTAAVGKYFKLLDADDAYDEKGLRNLLDVLKDTEADLVISPYQINRLSEEGNYSSSVIDEHKQLGAGSVRIEEADIRSGLAMFEICVKTQVLRNSGVLFTEKCFYTDNEFVMAAEMYSDTVMKTSLPVYIYRLGVQGQSMSVEGRRKHHKDKITAAKGVISIYRECPDKPAGTKKFLAENMISMMTREAYMSYMLMDKPLSYRAEIQNFDEELRQEMPEVYEITGQSRLVSAARKAGRAAYLVMCRRILRSETGRTGVTGRPAWYKAAEYAAAACMIIQSRTVWMHLENYGMYVNRGTWLILEITLIMCAAFTRDGKAAGLRNCSREILNKYALILIGTAAYSGFFILMNPVNELRVIRCASVTAMLLVTAVSAGGYRKLQDILRCFTDLTVIIASVSLVCWVCSSLLHILPITGWVTIDWSPTGEYVRIPTFLHVYYETQWTGLDFMTSRCSGIFTEAPMAGFCFSAALIADHFILSNEDRSAHRIRTLILAAAIISTQSAISVGTLFMTVIAGIIIRPDHARINSRLLKAAGAAAIIASAVLLVILFYNKIRWGSGSVRINDFVVGFRAWMAAPLFGGGFENLDYLREFMPSWRSGFDIGFSNSPMQILGQGGLYIGSVYIYAFIAALYKQVRAADRSKLAAVIIFGYMFIFTAVPYQYIVFFFLVMLNMTDTKRQNE